MTQVDLSKADELTVTVRSEFRFEVPITTMTTDRVIGSETITWEYTAHGKLKRDAYGFTGKAQATGVVREVWQTHDAVADFVQTKNATVSGNASGEIELRLTLGHLYDAPEVEVYTIFASSLRIEATEESYFYSKVPVSAAPPIVTTFSGKTARDVGFDGVESWPLPEEGKPIEGTTTKLWGRGNAVLTWSILDRGEPPEVARKCRGAFASVGPWESVGLGIFAHRRIEVSYERRLGLKEGRDLLIDDQAAGSVNRRYTRFLLRKNPSLTPAEKQRIKDAVGYPRADLIMHRGEQREFEEIKSDSSTGRTDGVKAVKDIEKWLVGHGLNYARGTSYISGSQVYYLPILDTIILGTFPVDYGIRVSRMPLKSTAPGVWPQDGLLLYNFCIKADWKKLVWSKLAKLFGLLILLAIVLKREGKRLPIELPPGTTLPVMPIKDPVRADLGKPIVTKMNWDPEVLKTWESLTPHQLDDIEALFEIDEL